LVDLPLATLIALLRPVLGQELAELVTRLLWPTALFAALCAVVGREAYRRAGPWAVAAVAVFAATSIGATGQFRPGRIDHHNVQILCAVAGLLLLVRSFNDHRLGWSAGALIGVGLAIGYEAIALVGPDLALAALIAVMQPARRVRLLPVAAAATLSLLAAGVLTTPPAGWFASRCDALSLNLIVVAASGTCGLWIAERFARPSGARLASLAAAALVGASAFAALEPACLAGPFGEVDPALKPIWLDQRPGNQKPPMVCATPARLRVRAVWLFGRRGGGPAAGVAASARRGEHVGDGHRAVGRGPCLLANEARCLRELAGVAAAGVPVRTPLRHGPRCQRLGPRRRRGALEPGHAGSSL